ncbi:MAG: DUF2207 domain-containing protein [Candidatus Altiarchaeota archaeon]|nr:DUF2207 domain-containing protein [Candidatus Altiarchaeota archaeon]
MITLEEAREIREQLRPAFAGYVTDGNISDRDVLATLMDLIVKGYIGIDAETQKKPVKVKKVYFVKTSDSLLPFEKKFIEELFKERKELSPIQVAQKIDSKSLHKIISDNTNALAKLKIVKSLLLLFDKRGDKVNLTYKATDAQDYGLKKDVKTMGDLECYKKDGILMIIVSFLLVLFYCWLFTISSSSLVVLGLLIMCSILLVLDSKKIIILTRVSKLLIFQFENNVVPFTKKKYEELFKFIQAYPLKHQRIYNEFMPHAVAFGLDTSWNSSFGIPTETIITSRAKQDLPDEVKRKVSDSEFIEHK